MALIPVLVMFCLLVGVGVLVIYWWKRGKVGTISVLLCWLLLTYEAIGLILNLAAGTVLFTAPTVLVARKYTDFSFDDTAVPMVGTGGQKILLAVPYFVYVVAATILIVAIIRVLLAYQRHTFFDRSFVSRVSQLGRALFFGGLATVITRFVVESASFVFLSPFVHAHLTDEGQITGWNGEWWSYGDGAAWIVPGIIIMMLPALIQKGVELQREVDYLV